MPTNQKLKLVKTIYLLEKISDQSIIQEQINLFCWALHRFFDDRESAKESIFTLN